MPAPCVTIRQRGAGPLDAGWPQDEVRVRSLHRATATRPDLRPGEVVLSSALEEPISPIDDPAVLLAGEKDIEGRSLGQIAWRRLKRDKVALAGGGFIVFLVVVAVFAPVIVKLTGDPPNEWHEDSST